MRAAPASHGVRQVVLYLPARFRTHLRVPAATDGDRRIGERWRAERKTGREVAGRPVTMTVRRRHLVLGVGILEPRVVQRTIAQHPCVADDRRPAWHREVEAGGWCRTSPCRD